MTVFDSEQDYYRFGPVRQQEIISDYCVQRTVYHTAVGLSLPTVSSRVY